ncbi:hypothetical protein B0H10DRAFT_2209253 [Mycena sp. CBHHK59/15]|nr:hypothetical protein B0H10DRAFT_2209253 [Mycena sp. CBHHK59/15]
MLNETAVSPPPKGPSSDEKLFLCPPCLELYSYTRPTNSSTHDGGLKEPKDEKTLHPSLPPVPPPSLYIKILFNVADPFTTAADVTPRKTRKTDSGTFHIPPHSDRTRDSPTHRKGKLQIATDAPLSFSSLSDYDSPPSPNVDSPMPGPIDPPLSASPSPAASPAPFGPQNMDVDVRTPQAQDLPLGMQNDDQPQPQEEQEPQPQPQPQPLAPLLPHLTPGLDLATTPAPTHNELMALTPSGRDDNPHRGYQDERAAPALLPSGRPPYQRNAGNFHNNAFPEARILDNVETETANTIKAARGDYLSVVVFNGGQRAFSVYKNIVGDVANAISGLTAGMQVEISRPAPTVVQTGDWSQKYVSPFCLFLRTVDPAVRGLLLAQGTFAVNRDLAFHVTPIDPFTLSWVVGLWAPMATTTDIHTLIRRIRAALNLLILNSPAIVARIAQVTQGVLVGTAAERARAVARSADAQYIPHATDPLFVVYLRPCTTDHNDWESVNALIRPRTLTYDMSSFMPKTANGPPECVVCKQDTHLAYICPFTGVGTPVIPGAPPHEWWGPPTKSQS